MECEIFSGYIHPAGYGLHSRPVDGERWAHRVAYAVARGPIPDGMTVDHLCREKRCVNVAHMELVTRGENARRGNLKDKCVRGHDMSVTRKIRADGRPRCGACPREYAKARN